MKRRGFTLVELLIVISILALLVAMLLPQLSAAKALSRQAVCAGHLQQINGAFGAVTVNQTGASVAPRRFVSTSDWPGLPYQSCPNKDIFFCADDSEDHTGIVAGQLLYYSWYNKGHPFVSFETSQWCASRRGADSDGAYTDYIFCDTDTETIAWDGDYHDGLVRIYDGVVNGKVKMVLQQYTCGAGASQHAAVYTGQEAIWDFYYIRVPPMPSQTYWLSTVITSYGINPAVNSYLPKPGTVVLLDFPYKVADPASPDFDTYYQRAARHRGKINVLTADGAVKAMGPTALSPRFPGGDVLWVP